MTGPGVTIAEADIHAFVDGRLDAEQRAAMEAALARDDVLAARVAAYREQNAALRGAYDAVLREPIPQAMLAAIRPSRRRIVLRHAVAASLYMAIGIGIGLLVAERRDDGTAGGGAGIPQRAALAYVTYAPEVRHPVEVSAAEEAHLQGWLSKRLGTPVRAPKLETRGFALVGGRLLPDPGGPAAQFMYEDGQGRRVTLYVRVAGKGRSDSAFRWHRQGNVSVCFWVDGAVGYALAGEIERDEIARLAELIYDQLNT
jgi:anti-sigma factor RsiW